MRKRILLSLVAIILIAPSLAASAEMILPEPYMGGRQQGILIGSEGEAIGYAEYWNQRNHFIVEMTFFGEVMLKETQVFLAREEPLYDPLYKNGKPVPGMFPCKNNFNYQSQTFMTTCSFDQVSEFAWGKNRHLWAAVHGDLANNAFWLLPMNADGNATSFVPYPKLKHGGYFDVMLTHPARGHFIDSPVFGLGYQTPTQWGMTDIAGGFDYFPAEFIDFWIGSYHLGSAIADQKVTPLDMFQGYDTSLEYITDPDTGEQILVTPVTNPVINMARFLQSLDADGDPKQGISITEPVVACFEAAMDELLYEELYFTEGGQIEDIIEETIAFCDDVEGVTLNIVSYEDAKEELDKALDNTMFRKNVSKTPDMSSSKSKMNIMRNWFPALRANGELAYYTTVDENGESQINYGIPYYDETGALITVETEAQPIAVAYTDAVQSKSGGVIDVDGPVYGEDIWVAISRDDGNTFKRTNVARAADRTSFDVTVKEYDELGNVVDEYLAPYYGEAKKPVMAVQDNNIFVAWTSKFCKGGRPTYAIKLDVEDDPLTEEDESADNYPYDDPYYEEDIWGVSGPQRSVDYAEQGFPEVGEVPYSCVWTARGTIVTQEMIDAGGYWAKTYTDEITGETAYYEVGDIVWFKPERLTSGRRDANQVFMGSFDGAGFAIAWQEDPEGLRPGQAKGPGPGWGGATTNHKTDIWYSYIHMDNFTLVDENFVPGGDPEHDISQLGRPKALVPMRLPVRITDNDVVNTDNLKIEIDPVTKLPPTDSEGNYIFTKLIPDPEEFEDNNGEHTGSHDYALPINNPGLCVDFVKKVPYSQRDIPEELQDFRQICVTSDGRMLDGDTGASRPNLFLQGYTHDNGTPKDTSDDYTSAWAIFAYDESKGVGNGPPDHEEGGGPYGGEYVAETGKNSFYMSFDFMNPPIVSAGTLINLPEKEYDITYDELGNPTGFTVVNNVTYIEDMVVDENGEPVLDSEGNPTFTPRYDDNGLLQINYENARRPRFIIQGKGNMGPSRTIMLMLYKEGEEGSGRPSDIMLRRVVVPTTDTKMLNPYRPENIVCNATETVDLDPTEGVHEVTVCVDGAQNMSTVQPTITTPSMGDPTSEDPYGAIKVVEWVQTPETLTWPSGINHYEDARAHRGALDKDFLIMGYSYTPNWAAYRNGNDKYDFFIRRSFDGGQTWTTDPNGVLAFDIVTNTETGQPEAVPGSTYSVVNCDTFTDPTQPSEDPDKDTGHLHYTVCTGYTPGQFEQARNLSQLPNAKSSVIEPRIVKSPGTYAEGVAAGHLTDQHRYGMYYVSYGTSTNPKKEKVYDESLEEWVNVQEDAAPMDLYYSYSLDLGETHEMVTWIVNPDSEGNYAGEEVTRWDWLAKGDREQGEAQLRMTPDGSRFYAVWVEEGYDNKGEYGSDIWFRRIMPPLFLNNVAPTTAE
jgi:hypothetical protein